MKTILRLKLSLAFVALFYILLSGCAKRVPLPESTADNGALLNKVDFWELTKDMVSKENLMKARAEKAKPQVIFPNDQVSITIYEKLPVSQEKKTEMKRVGIDGSILILPLGNFTIAGMTVADAQKTIESRLAEFVVSPFCEVEIVKRGYQPQIYVLGEVQTPGVFPLSQDLSLLDAISQVNGCTDNAYRRSIKIIRVYDNKMGMLDIDLYSILGDGDRNGNIALQDQDIVFVPRRAYTGFREVMSVLGQLVPWYYFAYNFVTPNP